MYPHKPTQHLAWQHMNTPAVPELRCHSKLTALSSSSGCFSKLCSRWGDTPTPSPGQGQECHAALQLFPRAACTGHRGDLVLGAALTLCASLQGGTGQDHVGSRCFNTEGTLSCWRMALPRAAHLKSFHVELSDRVNYTCFLQHGFDYIKAVVEFKVTGL